VKLDEIVKFIQQHFTDGLVLVIGSGLSCAEGLPGMPQLAEHLKSSASELKDEDAKRWAQIQRDLDSNQGLEAALLKYQPTPTLEAWIVRQTCSLLLPKEREIITAVVRGNQILRLTTFLNKQLRPPNGLPVLTPNYDRLVEVACEMAGFHVDTTAIGQYAGTFDPNRSAMASSRGIVNRGRNPMIDHYPRAVVLKPHGSLDWFKNAQGPMRCCIEIEAERLVITPGLNKYRAGYDSPFDKHREIANEHINRCARLLVIGYGFNDDHLQNHLVSKIKAGTPTLILTRTASQAARKLAQDSPQCVCLSRPDKQPGLQIMKGKSILEIPKPELWDLAILTKELLS